MQSAATDDRYRAYRDELIRERMPRAVRTAAFVLGAIMTAFIAVDALVFPEHFWTFLGVRLLLDGLLAGIYLWSSDRAPRASAYAVCLLGAASLLWVIFFTGAMDSSYYTGLVLLFVGMAVLLPLSARDALWISGAALVAFTSLGFLDGVASWRVGALHTGFLAAAAFESVMCASLLERMRFADFLRRKEVERARDELANLDQAKSRFTANMHHELRTPLTLTLAPLESLLAGDFGEVSELQRGYLKTMHANALRLLKLINSLLDLAKIESSQLELHRRQVAVGRIAEEILIGARPMAERKGIELRAEGLDRLPTAFVDPDAIEKVLVNLVGNALKFTESEGRIVVRAATRGDSLYLEVRDDGVGIEAAQLDKVFDRFAQVDNSATRKHEGTGIGLSLSKELVELHGGRIWAESEGVGRGTSMCVLLPIAADGDEQDEEILEALDGRQYTARQSFDALAAEVEIEGEQGEEYRLLEMERSVGKWEAARSDASEGVEDGGDGFRPEVLVTEDNPDMRKLLHFLLSKEFDVRTARNGREALEAVEVRAPDLILTDIMMPEMSGTELCRALKEDPRTQGIPVVLVTSKAERDMKIEGLELGADDYVTKPFHARELVARVRSLVRLRRLQEELVVRNQILERTNDQLEQAMHELKETEVQMVQAERLAAVGELAAGVAHEVNNPVNYASNALRTLRSYVDDIARGATAVGEIDAGDRHALAEGVAKVARLRAEVGFDELVDSLRELATIMTEGLDRTGRLVGDLRDFASPGAAVREPLDLRQGISSTLQLLRYAMQEAGVEAQFAPPASLRRVMGDARALNQVFLNLLKNACEALEETGGRVWVDLESREDSVIVTIRDDGPGIAPEAKARLFEPFFTTKEAGRGTGLGLSISRRIVTEHGGRIEVVSAPDDGTCFTIHLPAEESSAA